MVFLRKQHHGISGNLTTHTTILCNNDLINYMPLLVLSIITQGITEAKVFSPDGAA
jgi:hypothetical protein